MALRFDQPLPPAFDPGFYRAHHPDLALPDDAAALAHYDEHGRVEGRLASPLARREALVAAISPQQSVLEIGPFCAPLLAGPGVRYLDRLDAGGLRARAAALGMDTAHCPERIHHVGDLAAVPADSFDAVVASHSIEHQPDLVRHLEEVARVLRTHGRYWLVVPDKRFCFDHFLPETTIAEVLDAFEGERTTHRLASVVEHVALVTHNDPVRHWRGDHGALDEAERRRRTMEALACYRSSGGDYLDVHAWQFTPPSFAALGETLARLGLSAFEIERVYDTPRDQAEFCAVLRRARPARRSPRRRHGREIVLLHGADPVREVPYLATTAGNVADYCRRLGLGYRSAAGPRPLAAMLRDLLASGFRGWAGCLAADEFVRNPDFDLPALLEPWADRPALTLGEGMPILLNLGHPLGQEVAEAFSREAPTEGEPAHGDRARLAGLLRDMPDAVQLDPPPSFLSHAPAAEMPAARLSALRDEVAAVAGAWGVEAPPAQWGSRAEARLLHPLQSDMWLAEAPPGQADEAAARCALEAWRSAAAEVPDADQREWIGALEAGDLASLAAMVRALGRGPAGRGLLGGDRQHRRCAEDPAFARERMLRTHDELLSLAELTGAVPLENPDLGRWGVTPRLTAPALFAELERALDRDLAPPRAVGGYLGVEVGRGLVLHLRMVEAIHKAWRIGQLAALADLRDVTELGGGIGLTAWYARRLGIARYRLVAPAATRALQAAVLAELVPPVAGGGRVDRPLDLLVVEDLAAWPEEVALAHLADATAAGAHAILAFGSDAPADPARPQPTIGQLLSRLGGWVRVGRTRHGLKPGHVEELFRRAH